VGVSSPLKEEEFPYVRIVPRVPVLGGYQIIMVVSPACRHGCRETTITQLDQPRIRLGSPHLRIYIF